MLLRYSRAALLSSSTMFRGWFGDAIHILGRQYSPMGPFDQLPECDTAAIVAHMQRLYLTGPHRQGPIVERASVALRTYAHSTLQRPIEH
jgi:hypothetical protein